jgi:hypothetical protein
LPRYPASGCVYPALYSIKEPAGTEAQSLGVGEWHVPHCKDYL